MPENKFNSLNKPELQAAGEIFAVDLKSSMKKDEMIAELEANGVTYEQYEAALQDASDLEEEELDDISEDELPPLEPEDVVAVEAADEPEEDLVLVKMTRANPRYDAYGYSFTREHPFVPVPEEVAELLIENHGGFEIARPREFREYYGA